MAITTLLDKVYSAIGLKRLSPEKNEVNLSESQWATLDQILAQINAGEIPENYKNWVEFLLGQLPA